MNAIIHSLKQRRLLWQGRQQESLGTLSETGYATLDEYLQGGFPEQGVIQVFSDIGVGEVRLFCPFLHQRYQRQRGLLVFIGLPYQLHAEFWQEQGFDLQDILVIAPKKPEDVAWAAEQCLHSGCCDMLLLWPEKLTYAQGRRLQLAAVAAGASLLMFRPIDTYQQWQGMPVELSLAIRPSTSGIELEVLKMKGPFPRIPHTLHWQRQWPHLVMPTSSSLANDNVLAFPRVS